MAVYRIPILVWQDWEGFFTACPVELDTDLVGTGVSASAALRQIQGYLQWLIRREPWFPPPDFLDPRLVYHRVAVRPEYKAGKRVYPSTEPLEIKVACVVGRRSGGLQACSLPMLGLRMDYYERDAWQNLAAERVRKLLSGLTPRELARFLPPQDAFLEEVSVRPPQKVNTGATPKFPALSAVAEAVGHPSVRKRYLKPWQRETELAELVARLGRKAAPVLLLGESGAGKSTLLVAAARAVERLPVRPEEAPPITHPFRFWLTSAARLIAGMKYLGQWEERCEDVVSELSQINGVLCVANLLDLVRHGGHGPEDSLAAFFLPYLQTGELRMVAEATPAELDACRRLLPGLADVFEPLRLRQLSRVEARAALGQVAAAAGQEGRIAIEPAALESVCRLFSRFMPYQALPGRAAPFVGRLVEAARRQARTLVTPDDVLERFVKQTGLPEQFLRDDYPLPPAEIAGFFQSSIFGQDEACDAATRIVSAFKAGLNDPGRPAGVFLFCGPTGVGKTELARLLSQYFFGHGEKADRLIRLDMSEYSGWGAARRLIAQPDGAPSEFISRMRRQPFAVILLDEIEKAQADVFDMLLGLFDEGRLTDAYGRVTNFCSSLIVMTSNLGAGRRQSIGYGERGPGYETEVRSFFRPEFFNRIDEVVTFAPLNAATCLAITRKELGDLSQREGLLKNRLRLAPTDRLIELLTREGFDPRYGARPLQRTLETRVVSRLAHFLVNHPDLCDATLNLDAEGDQVRIS